MSSPQAPGQVADFFNTIEEAGIADIAAEVGIIPESGAPISPPRARSAPPPEESAAPRCASSHGVPSSSNGAPKFGRAATSATSRSQASCTAYRLCGDRTGIICAWPAPSSCLLHSASFATRLVATRMLSSMSSARASSTPFLHPLPCPCSARAQERYKRPTPIARPSLDWSTESSRTSSNVAVPRACVYCIVNC